MSKLFLATLITILIGASLLMIVRISRKSYEKKYGASTKNERLRFMLLFIINLLAISSLIYFRPLYGFIYIIGIVALFAMGIIPIKKGVAKDFLYSSLVCSVIIGLASVLFKASI